MPPATDSSVVANPADDPDGAALGEHSTSTPVSVSASTRHDLPHSDPESEPLVDTDRQRSTMPRLATSTKSAKASSSSSVSGSARSVSMSASASMVSSPAASSSSRTSSSMGFDRELFVKLEDVTSELDRLSRLSNTLPENRALEAVQTQLKRAQRHSSVMVQSQRELLDKIDRHERSSFRRYFQFNREHKVESLKDKLYARMSESATVESELQQLERKSDTLLEARRTLVGDELGSSRGPGGAPSLEAAQIAWRMDELERTRQHLVGTLLQTLPVPETQQLSTRIAMYVSEIRASESIQKQVERCATMYREALRNLQAALAILLAPTYAGTLKEFVTGPYIMAVEASHQMEAASHVLQPEAQRRYRRYAPDLQNVRPPKFPQAISDFAKRARVNYDRKSSLSNEGTRKLHAAENVVVLLHRIVIQKLELINQWLLEVEQDVSRATEAHRRAESRLHEQMAVVARSASE